MRGYRRRITFLADHLCLHPQGPNIFDSNQSVPQRILTSELSEEISWGAGAAHSVLLDDKSQATPINQNLPQRYPLGGDTECRVWADCVEKVCSGRFSQEIFAKQGRSSILAEGPTKAQQYQSNGSPSSLVGIRKLDFILLVNSRNFFNSRIPTFSTWRNGGQLLDGSCTIGLAIEEIGD